jgi:hypothetical protein
VEGATVDLLGGIMDAAAAAAVSTSAMAGELATTLFQQQ